jgi:hypothetical protein
MFAVLQQVNNNQAAHIATIISRMWKSRNLRIWQWTTETSSSILEHCKTLVGGSLDMLLVQKIISERT